MNANDKNDRSDPISQELTSRFDLGSHDATHCTITNCPFCDDYGKYLRKSVQSENSALKYK